jgi:hypothetical protein
MIEQEVSNNPIMALEPCLECFLLATASVEEHASLRSFKRKCQSDA